MGHLKVVPEVKVQGYHKVTNANLTDTLNTLTRTIGTPKSEPGAKYNGIIYYLRSQEHQNLNQGAIENNLNNCCLLPACRAMMALKTLTISCCPIAKASPPALFIFLVQLPGR